MAIAPALSPRLQLSKAVRERFVAEMGLAMAEVGGAVMGWTTPAADAANSLYGEFRLARSNFHILPARSPA